MSLDLQLESAFQTASSGLAATTAGALVAGLWQGMLLCVAAGLILKVVPKSPATLRFVVWVTVFGVSVAMPFVNFLAAFTGRASGASVSHVLLDLSWSYVLAGLWLVFAACRLGQLALQGIGLRALWVSAVPIAIEALDGIDVSLSVHGRRVELCTSGEVDRPSVIGFFAPRVLIPTWLFDQLTSVELNHIVLHELEHLRRRDDWVNLLQKVGLVLLPLNPALFWIDRRLSTERELACDDGVLERTKMPKAYAASLASIAERRLDVQRHGRLGALALAATGLAMGLGRRHSELGRRIESILGRRTASNRVAVFGLTSALIVGVVGAGAGLACAPRLISFGPGAVSQQAGVRPVMIAPREAVSPTSVNSRMAVPVAQFENASFRQLTRVHARSVKSVARKRTHDAGVRNSPQNITTASKQQRLMVLTSWQDSPISRVVVQTPDGKFFLTPYAAVPTQAGWLLVQL